jgi:PAS domain S-box-containing protein
MTMHEPENAGLATAGLPIDVAQRRAAVVVTQADGAFVYVSDAFCDLVGCNRAELLGRRADAAAGAGSAERTGWILERTSEVGAAFRYRRLYETAAGDRLVDVSVHRAAEDLIMTTMIDVSEHETGIGEAVVPEPFVDAVPLGLVVYDRALRIVGASCTVEECGHGSAGHPEEPTDALADVAPDVVAAVESVLGSGEHIMNLAVTRPDGARLLLNVFPIRDAHDAVVQVGCIFSEGTGFADASPSRSRPAAALGGRG